MSSRKGILLLTMIVCVCTLALSVPVRAQQSVKLTFAGWIGMEDATKPLLQQMIKGFEAANPGIQVEYVGYPWADQYNQLVLAVSGGTAPDLAQIDINFPALFELGAFEPL